MSKANARELMDGVLFSNRESAEELAAVAQVEATLAVADEIAALRGEVERLAATQVGRAYLAEGDIKGRVYVAGFESAVKDVRDELDKRAEKVDLQSAGDMWDKGRVQGLGEATDLLDSVLAPVESEEK